MKTCIQCGTTLIGYAGEFCSLHCAAAQGKKQKETTVAEQLAKLAHLACDARAVDTYEDLHRFRAYSQRCDIAALWSKALSDLTSIPAEQWHAKRQNENEREEHLCDSASHHECMCKGACSCHWVQLEALPAQVVRKSHKQLEALQAQIKQAIEHACR